MISDYLLPLDEVDRSREAHQAFLDGLEERGIIVSAGRRNPPVGGVVILDVPTAEEAIAVMADDPYVKANAAAYKPVGFNPTRGVTKAPGR